MYDMKSGQVGETTAERARRAWEQAPVTCILAIANILIFLVETVAGGSRDVRVALLFGAQATALLEMGQYWRLFASMFLHFGIVHLLCNMASLCSLGPMVERVYGRIRYLVIYLVAGLSGNLLTWWVEVHGGDRAVSAGASGAIFGLFGAYIALAILPAVRRTMSVRGIAMTLILNIAYGISYSEINMAAHVGGFAGGLLLSAWMVAGLMRKAPPC